MPVMLVFAAVAAVLAQDPAPIGTPVFDCYHVNRAWGFLLTGTVIDDRGRIFTYRSASRGVMPAAAADSTPAFIADADLALRFENRTPVGRVEKRALDANIALIAEAATGSVTRSDGGARDAGVSACHAYLHDANHHRVRDVELGSFGSVNDRLTTNSSDAGWSF